MSSDGDADGGGTADDIVAMNKEARISDVCESMKQQLLAFIEWAKEVPYFDSLNLSDRIALVREHACEHLLLQASYRSLGVNDFVLLGNGTVASSSSADPTIAFTVTRVLKELIAPLRRIQMDDSELVLLKALLLFDPRTYDSHHMIPPPQFTQPPAPALAARLGEMPLKLNVFVYSLL